MEQPVQNATLSSCLTCQRIVRMCLSVQTNGILFEKYLRHPIEELEIVSHCFFTCIIF
jgi:predicted molibdopterin-dependent oxidoreductase YjgC